MDEGLHHISKRKRATIPSLEDYPHKKKSYRFLDRFLIFIAILGPLMASPQIFKIYSNHSAQGISIITFGMWSLIQLPWILYGIVHREKPVLIAHTLWFFAHLAVLMGALIYG